jgi:hypothetical protein
MSAFWLWLRDFFLNIAANVAANAFNPTDVIGYAVGLVFAIAWVIHWHRKRVAIGRRGMDSWYFIALSLVIAGIGIGGAAYGVGFRSARVDTSAQTKSALPMAAGLIKDPHIDWDDKDRISLQGRFMRSGGPVTVYVTYGQTGGDQRPVIGGSLAVEPRIKIGSLAHFDHDERVNVAIGHVVAVEGNQQIIQWGEPEQNNTKVGITWGSYFGSVIFVWPDGSEEPYSFAIVSKSQQGKPAAPVVIGPDVLQTLATRDARADNPVKR